MRRLCVLWLCALSAFALDLRIDGTEAALRAALAKVAAAGGGTITFNVANAVIAIEDRIYFHGHRMILDGENRNLVFRYTGPDACNQTEGQDSFIEIHGDRNVIRNFTLDGFPDGIHVQSGYDNVIENVRFPKVCEDAVTNNGRGFEAFRTVIRNCYFRNSEDKAVMINNGGSLTVENCEFVDCQQPVRAGGQSGRYTVRQCRFRGRSTGPRFNGGADGMVVEFEDNVVEEASYGIRVYGSVLAILRNNRFRPRAGNGSGIYVYENARARIEGNDVQGAARGGVRVQGAAQADLGGGKIVICGDGTASAGRNILKGNQPADLVNETETLIKAKSNLWDHASAAEVLSLDVRGPAEVEPLGTPSVPEQGWRRQIKAALFVPDPLPALAPETHGRFEPAAGVVAERVTYATQFGMRVPAILYLPKTRSGKIPAFIVVNGHGGDKYSWYAFYSGILYARAGAAVLTYDPAGEGECNIDRKSGTRAHDKVEPPRELAQRLGGLMMTDVMQAVSYLSQRPEVDSQRIAAAGYSMGSLVLSLACAVETRLKACVLVGGGNLDGPGEYWDKSKQMCQGIPYQSLMFLGDRPAALYALHAARGATLVYNGLEDTTVRIPPNAREFFLDLQRRTAALRGSSEGIFETGFVPGVGHRPFFVTKPVALWLERQLDFPNWTEEAIRAMPETHISAWAKEHGVEMDPLYATEHREGGARALGSGVPGLSRQDLSVLSPQDWERRKSQFIHEAWLERAKAAIAAREAPVTLVENGVARATIVVGASASRAVRFAAQELQTYVEKVSGARLPVRDDARGVSGPLVIVGASEATLGPEGFRIRTADGNLTFAAKDDAGTQYAVYTFLEKHLGVRWLWPGELGEVVPRTRTVAVPPIDETQQPHFKWRNRGPGGALWGAPTGPTEMRARERLLGVSAEHQAQVALWETRNRWGGLKIYGGHSLGEVFPPEKYARTHPEFYALINGKREVPGPDYDYKHGGQVCTTNPGVVRATIDWVRNLLNQHPEYHGVHITMNDSGGFCECDRCRALDSGELLKRPGIEAEEMKKAPSKYGVITDRVFTFVNQVAEEVEKTHPGKYVASMAYARYAPPPRRIRLRPSVISQYCLWSAYRHANAAMRDEQHATAAAWARAGGRAGIYEYYINGSWPGFHRLVVPQIAVSIKHLHSVGIDLFQTQSGDDFAINGINYYVAGRLLWDTSQDPAAILDDFYRKGFQKAAPAIRRYHERLQGAWRAATAGGEDINCSSFGNTRFPELFTEELLAECRRDLAEASRLADNETVRRRVEFYGQGLRFTELTVAAVHAARRAFAVTQQKPLIDRALQAWAERDRFVEQLKDDFVVAYFWVRYNDLQRDFHPGARLRKLP